MSSKVEISKSALHGNMQLYQCYEWNELHSVTASLFLKCVSVAVSFIIIIPECLSCYSCDTIFKGLWWMEQTNELYIYDNMYKWNIFTADDLSVYM